MALGGVVEAPIRAGQAQRDYRKVGAGPAADAVHHDAMPRTLALIVPVVVLVAPHHRSLEGASGRANLAHQRGGGANGDARGSSVSAVRTKGSCGLEGWELSL
jgi:hypothetical protein